MSTITEYLKLLPRAIPNADKIIKAIITDVQYKKGMLPEAQKAEIVRRRVICEGCPFMSKNSTTSEEYLSLTGKHYTTRRQDEHCSFCGCTLTKRTASFDSECGISTWNEENPDKQIPLKWTKFETDGQAKN